ncbi:lycopene cyclase family protein [Lentzea sp. JNUCC 0626]|uniref:lycopene cyclase family protein n=1 Tax=Lentzea sp. JNUCC 0626 TaxID=3367513 RepID=UPI0037494C0F
MTYDVMVIGGGPAGRALARACAELGLHTAIVDRHPHRPWTATYGAWADELPFGTPVKTTSTAVMAYAREEHRIDRTYVVLDNAKLHELPDTVDVLQRPEAARYTFNATGARKGRAEQTAVGTFISSTSTEVTLMDWRGDGDTFLYTVPVGDGRVLVEETCLARRPGMPLGELRQRLRARGWGGRTGVEGAEEVRAHGDTGEGSAGEGLGETGDGPAGERLGGERAGGGLREWGAAAGSGGEGPRGRDETGAGGVDGLGGAEVRGTGGRGRSGAGDVGVRGGTGPGAAEGEGGTGAGEAGGRAGAGGVRGRGAAGMGGGTGTRDVGGQGLEGVGEERVRFPLDSPRVGGLAFGASAGFIHPATGYSVATALQLAPRVAEACKGGRDPLKVIWPAKARVVHAMRRKGLEALLRLDAEETKDFFELFFRLDAELQVAYLSGREDVVGTARAMGVLFKGAGRLRWKLV